MLCCYSSKWNHCRTMSWNLVIIVLLCCSLMAIIFLTFLRNQEFCISSPKWHCSSPPCLTVANPKLLFLPEIIQLLEILLAGNTTNKFIRIFKINNHYVGFVCLGSQQSWSTWPWFLLWDGEFVNFITSSGSMLSLIKNVCNFFNVGSCLLKWGFFNDLLFSMIC